jgi:MHS family proline/betaine transporter-like MFS transporter
MHTVSRQSIPHQNISHPQVEKDPPLIPILETSVIEAPVSVKKSIFLISVLGTVLEYFEYAIYGFLAPILALHFFPSDDPTTSLLKTFGVFALGSLSKPLGALIFGQLGDTKGRRISLRYSMIGISVPTFIVGILPGHDTLGWGAAFALILCRMLQGMFVAGESDGVRIYIFEHFGKKRPCFINAFVVCSAYIGIALASLVATLIPAEGEAWRLVFLGCSLFGVITYILRRFLVETPPFLAYQKSHPSPVPLKQILSTNWGAFLRTIMICGMIGGSYHFYMIFLSTYLSKVLGLIPTANASLYGFWLTSVYVLTLPLAGWMADQWGVARVAKTGGVIALGLVALNTLLMIKGIVPFSLPILITVSIAFFALPAMTFLLQRCDVGIRFRCQSVGHAVGSMLFSGTTPVICLFLWHKTGLSYSPFLYILALVAMGLGALIWGDWKLRAKA